MKIGIDNRVQKNPVKNKPDPVFILYTSDTFIRTFELKVDKK